MELPASIAAQGVAAQGGAAPGVAAQDIAAPGVAAPELRCSPNLVETTAGTPSISAALALLVQQVKAAAAAATCGSDCGNGGTFCAPGPLSDSAALQNNGTALLPPSDRPDGPHAVSGGKTPSVSSSEPRSGPLPRNLVPNLLGAAMGQSMGRTALTAGQSPVTHQVCSATSAGGPMPTATPGWLQLHDAPTPALVRSCYAF